MGCLPPFAAGRHFRQSVTCAVFYLVVPVFLGPKCSIKTNWLASQVFGSCPPSSLLSVVLQAAVGRGRTGPSISNSSMICLLFQLLCKLPSVLPLAASSIFASLSTLEEAGAIGTTFQHPKDHLGTGKSPRCTRVPEN